MPKKESQSPLQRKLQLEKELAMLNVQLKHDTFPTVSEHSNQTHPAPSAPPEDTVGMISKKIAAQEAVKQLKTTFTVSLISIIGYFLIALSGAFSPQFSSVAALIMFCFSTYYVYITRKRMKELQVKYGVQA